MKKTWVIVVNVLIMVAMLTFVVIYSGIESRNMTQVQIEHFENTTITMRHVTENYLEGEQRICDVWARYINSNDLTIEDAVSFIRISHVLPNASAHIVYVDTLSGLSTKARQTTSSDYSVSYSKLNLLNDLGWISGIGESTNITRAYTNPVNNEALYLKLVDKAIHDPSFDSLREIPETGDLKRGFELAHALKGVTANLALTPLFDPVNEITELFWNRTETDYRPYIEAILSKRDDLIAL